VVVIALIRLKSFYDLFNVVNPDPTYALGVTISVVEVNVAITLCCGPAINSMITRFAPKLFASRGASSHTAVTAENPYGYEMPTRRPKRYEMPSLSSSRNIPRPYRVMDEEEAFQLPIMNNADHVARRSDVIRAMIDNDRNGRGMYVR
jgi:hypothetical protein